MKFGYHIVAETVTRSRLSRLRTTIDMTHVGRFIRRRWIPVRGCGFKGIEARFSSPIPDEARLRKLPPIRGMDAEEKNALFELYNHNIELLNGILYGAQDYAVIGKK